MNRNLLSGQEGQKNALVLFGTGIIVLALYFRGLKGEFVRDDVTYFVENDILPNLSPFDITAFFRPSNYWGELLPFRDWFYALQGSIFQQDPYGYHLVSLAIFILAIWSFHLLLKEWHLTNSINQGDQSQLHFGGCLFILALFAVHPSHVESVANIAGQKDLLLGLWGFLSLLFWGRYYREGKSSQLFLFIACYYLAFLSKLTAVFLPCFILVLALTLYLPFSRKPLKKAVFFGLINLPIVIWILHVLRVSDSYYGTTSSISTLPLLDRILRAIQILGAHVKLSLIPLQPSATYPFEYTNHLNANFFIGCIFLTILLSVIYFKNKFMTIGLTLHLLSLLPALQLFQELNNSTIYDRYLFIAIAGNGIFFYHLAIAIIKNRAASCKIFILPGILYLILLSYVSFHYVPSWESDLTTTRHSYLKYPDDPTSGFNYATTLIEFGKYNELYQLIRTEKSLTRPNWVPNFLLGWASLEQGRVKEAERLLRDSAIKARIGGYYPFPNYYLAQALIALERQQEAMFYLDQISNNAIYHPLFAFRTKQLLNSLH